MDLAIGRMMEDKDGGANGFIDGEARGWTRGFCVRRRGMMVGQGGLEAVWGRTLHGEVTGEGVVQ